MKAIASLAAFAAAGVAQQFVLYAKGDASYSQRADPIMTPGEISGHVHDFAGSSSFEAELSYEALQNSGCTTVGSANESAGGFVKDNSVYWHPAMYAKSKGGSDYIKVPTTLHKMYYRKPPAKQYADPFQFPPGFRMVAGDPFRRSANTQVSGITHWQCMGPGNVGEGGGFPTLDQPCDAYSGLVGKVHFPHCWNGQSYSQDNPSAHMSYPEGDASFGDCPRSHPYALPHIEFENLFEMSSTWEEIDPSTLTLAQGDSTGYGWHGDFFNGWVNGTIPDLLENCPQPEYGNQDVGECPQYEHNTTPRSECKLKNYYKEKVDTPGTNLIGCNPISLLDPAPKLPVAPLGMSSDPCGSGSDGSSDSDSILPVYSSPASPPSSFAVSTTAVPYVPKASYVDEEEVDEDVVYVTKWVEEFTTARAHAKRDLHNQQHNHLRKHKRLSF